MEICVLERLVFFEEFVLSEVFYPPKHALGKVLATQTFVFSKDLCFWEVLLLSRNICVFERIRVYGKILCVFWKLSIFGVLANKFFYFLVFVHSKIFAFLGNFKFCVFLGIFGMILLF